MEARKQDHQIVVCKVELNGRRCIRTSATDPRFKMNTQECHAHAVQRMNKGAYTSMPKQARPYAKTGTKVAALFADYQEYPGWYQTRLRELAKPLQEVIDEMTGPEFESEVDQNYRNLISEALGLLTNGADRGFKCG